MVLELMVFLASLIRMEKIKTDCPRFVVQAGQEVAWLELAGLGANRAWNADKQF